MTVFRSWPRGAARAVPLVLWSVLIGSVVGCSGARSDLSSAQRADQRDCGGSKCHESVVKARLAGPHAEVACEECHEGASGAHAQDPEAQEAAVDWRIDSCAPCHDVEAETYLYDDHADAGPFGGSQTDPEKPKANTFPLYNTIIAGHGFAKEYNEEGSHAVMLEAHFDISRTKYETCVQCKSTRVALAWRDGRTVTIEQSRVVTLTHTADPKSGTAPKTIEIPKGTRIAFATDRDTRATEVVVTFPDGRVVSSMPKPSEDATLAFNTTWAATIAASMSTWPYGAGCDHCHDPHSTKLRLVRSAMLDAIEEAGSVNPYDANAAEKFDSATRTDQRNLVCGQCHVEYTCGKSGVDGVDRDAFGWTKASELHDRYLEVFGYKQDWKHKLIGEPLIKSQHPELETYWESVHEVAGVTCEDCHMPEVRTDSGKTVRSHWMTSPFKYSNAELFSRFAKATPVSNKVSANPCVRCHEDRTAAAIAQQRAVFERQKKVQQRLALSVEQLAAVKVKRDAGAPVDKTSYDKALTAHRKAHVLWENLIVSENSMGFHDYEEVITAMESADAELTVALDIEAALLK